MDNNSNSVWIPCKNGHVFVYPGDFSLCHIQENASCLCGQTIAHWEKCPTCGQERLVAVPIKKKEGDKS